MEIIIGGRRNGKTTLCLEWVKKAKFTNSYPFWDRVLICVHSSEANRLRKQLQSWARSQGWTEPKLGLIYNMVYAAEEWRTASIGQEPVEVMIDNADLVLQEMFRRSSIRGITLNDDDKYQNKVLDGQGGWIEL